MAVGCGGERGIRTLDTLLGYTRSPGVLLKPLGHLSFMNALFPVLRNGVANVRKNEAASN